MQNLTKTMPVRSAPSFGGMHNRVSWVATASVDHINRGSLCFDGVADGNGDFRRHLWH
jgi:hypothetical protein